MKALALVAALAAPAHADCDPDSAVLGRGCDGFGAWAHRMRDDVSLAFMTSSFVVDRFELPDVDARQQVYTATTGSHAHSQLAGSRRLTTYGYRTGARYHGRRWVLALEMSAAGGTSPPIATAVDAMSTVGSGTALAGEIGLVAGRHARSGRLDAGVEVAAGVRGVTLDVPLPAGYQACRPGEANCPRATATVAQSVVEVRARADAWLTRQVTLGVSIGADPRGGATSLAVNFVVHLQPYDGN